MDNIMNSHLRFFVRAEMLLSRPGYSVFSTFWNGVIPKSLSQIMSDNYLDEELLGNPKAVK